MPMEQPVEADERGTDDALLARQAQAGDLGAFSRLVVRYQDRVLNLCWRLSGNLEDAQDLAQEAFLKALEKITSYRHQAGFYTWLFRIAVNQALSLRRKTGRRPTLSLHACSDDGQELIERVGDPRLAAADRMLEMDEARACIEKALDDLEDDHRCVLVLRDIEGMDYQQMADVLEVSVGTIKSRLHRARMALRERLKSAG